MSQLNYKMKLLDHRIIAVLFFLLTLQSCSVLRHYFAGEGDVSPLDYGLASAKTGVDRYNILFDAHKSALEKGVNVDYSGLDTIFLEIPKKSASIPLTQYNDFKGCVFVVNNTAKNCWLFSNIETETPINVPKELIDTGIICSLNSLNRGRYILIIEDNNPWVLNRKGHSYGHQRKDILLIENGIAKNSVIMPYNNEYSSPTCAYVKVKPEPLVLKNITIVRDKKCDFVTQIANISGFDKVNISNISIHTPQSELVDDRGIRINNCTNVELRDVHIDGTYSQKNHSGYGITLNNIWNFKAVKLFGKGNWGIFGNNNINVATITDSEINRFDIHCYGRDVTFKGVKFVNLYNQFTSTYGTIRFENCTFSHFTPILYEKSYNTYVPHDVVFNKCDFVLDSKHFYLIDAGQLNVQKNSRTELSDKCWPNVEINNLTVITDGQQKDFNVFKFSKEAGFNGVVHSINKIIINGLYFECPEGQQPMSFNLVNDNVSTENTVFIYVNRL